ncbi:MAG: hypothetical protein AAF741_15200 [Bacteroidota bacterium]
MSPTNKATLLLIAIYAVVSAVAHRVWEDDFIVISWDGYGYYAYLPSIFIYGTDDDYAFSEQHFEQYEIGSNLYQVRDAPNSRRFPIYNIGLAVLWLPFFLLAHGYCLLFGGFEPNGMSWPYQLSIWLAAMFYLSLGWWYLSHFLSRHLTPKTAAWTLILVGLGTNLFYYGYRSVELTHFYLFALYAAFLFYFQQYIDSGRPWQKLIIPGMLAGLMVLIRSSEVVVFLLPALWSWDWKLASLKRNFVTTLSMVGLAVPVYAIQLLYYKYALDTWWVNGYAGHSFDWPPHLYECLIGYRRGWLVYTPLAAFMLLGIVQLFRRGSRWAWPILTFTFCNCMLLFSWHLWNYGSTFGSRPVVQSYAILALPLGLLAYSLWQQVEKIGSSRKNSTRESLPADDSQAGLNSRNNGSIAAPSLSERAGGEDQTPHFSYFLKLFICTSAGGFIALNLFQTWQYEQRIIPMDLNNRTHYWHNFLATELDRHNYRFLFTNEKLPARKSYDWQTLATSDSAVLLPGQGENFREYHTFYRQEINASAATKFSGAWTRTRLDFAHLPDPQEWENEPVLIFEVTRPDTPEPVRWTRIYLPAIINNPARDTVEIDMQLPTLQAGDTWQVYQWNPSADSTRVYESGVYVLK